MCVDISEILEMHCKNVDMELLPSMMHLAELALMSLGIDDDIGGVVFSDLDDIIEQVVRDKYGIDEDTMFDTDQQILYNDLLQLCVTVTEALRAYFVMYNMATIDRCSVYTPSNFQNGVLFLSMRGQDELRAEAEQYDIWEKRLLCSSEQG